MENGIIIDFHVHFFPDSISNKVIKKLGQIANIKAFGNGSIKSLQDFMNDDGISYSINQPIATKPEQVVSINRQMIELNQTNGSIFTFGAIHPEFYRFGNVREEIEFLSQNKIKGIKLHPEYQDFYPNDDRMTRIYEACRDFNLVILFHGGRDYAFNEVHGTPERLAEVTKIKPLKIICAHLGGYQMWNEVEKYLLGNPEVYFDTALTEEMDNNQMKELITGHGVNKILFGSDFPWKRQSGAIEKIESLGLPIDSEEKLFYKNACELLDLNV